jgi:hypothetical protein
MQRNAEKNESMRSGASFASPLRASASPRLCVKAVSFSNNLLDAQTLAALMALHR